MDENTPDIPTDLTETKQASALHAQELAKRINEAPTATLKAQLLWALPTAERYAALGELPADIVAAVIESNPEENMALLGNLPAPKFSQIANMTQPAVGREWLERAVTCGLLAAQMLPAMMSARDLMPMLVTEPDLITVLPRLLNYDRATQMRTVLHPMEWKNSLDDLLLADAEDLLRKAPIKNRGVKAVLQSLLDFFPETYLETVRLALAAAKYRKDHPDEVEDITETPFAMPEFLEETTLEAVSASNGHSPSPEAPSAQVAPQSATDLIPAAADPFMTLATSKLSDDRRTQLEEELRGLLRTEIVATGSFAIADINRAAGRLLYQLRAGLEQVGGRTPDTAAKVMETRSLSDIAQTGARVAERIRQKSLRLAGFKDWLDRHQKQFLAGITKLEPGIDSLSGLPVLKIASRPNQAPEEWPGYTADHVEERLEDISTWAGLARAAFGSASRTQLIFATAKTKTAEEATRRTVIALCLYRRWEPELVRAAEDMAPFRRQFADSLRRLNPAREIVLAALDATPDEAWRPADAKAKARNYMLRAIDELEKMKF
ncbi:MAG TPA: DUF6178 family protein [Capsulimonadaceae bacterium]